MEWHKFLHSARKIQKLKQENKKKQFRFNKRELLFSLRVPVGGRGPWWWKNPKGKKKWKMKWIPQFCMPFCYGPCIWSTTEERRGRLWMCVLCTAACRRSWRRQSICIYAIGEKSTREASKRILPHTSGVQCKEERAIAFLYVLWRWDEIRNWEPRKRWERDQKQGKRILSQANEALIGSSWNTACVFLSLCVCVCLTDDCRNPKTANQRARSLPWFALCSVHRWMHRLIDQLAQTRIQPFNYTPDWTSSLFLSTSFV